MESFPSAKRIGIFGHVGTQNLGDEIIIAATIQNIRRRCPGAEIVAFTFNPEDTRIRHGISAFPIRRTNGQPAPGNKLDPLSGNNGAANPTQSFGQRIRTRLKMVPLLHPILKGMERGWNVIWGALQESRFLVQCYRNLKGTDLLIIAGSGQLTDHSGGPWAYPYTLFKWSALASVLQTKFAFLSVGTSWINSRLSEFFLRYSLSRASYRSYRDESSCQMVKKLGLPGETLFVPDLAYSFQMSDLVAKSPGLKRSPVVGINAIPYFHHQFWHQADESVYKNYVSTQADFALWLIQRGYAVFFFPTQLRADPPVIQDIKQLVKSRGGAQAEQGLMDGPILASGDLISAISGMDMVVAARYHGVLLSLLLSKRVLGIAYHQKTSDLMAQVGQSQYALDIEDCTLQTLRAKFLSLEAYSNSIEGELRSRVLACREALQVQYDRVFDLLQQSPAQVFQRTG